METVMQDTKLAKSITVHNNSTFDIDFLYTGLIKGKTKKDNKVIKEGDSAVILVAKEPKHAVRRWGLGMLFGGISRGTIQPHPDMLLDRWIKECTVKVNLFDSSRSFVISEKNFNTVTIVEAPKTKGYTCDIQVDEKTYRIE